MKRWLVIGLLLVWCCPAAHAQEEKKDTRWTVPEKVEVPLGGIGYLAVKIDRAKIPEEVQVEVANLPKGVAVKGDAKITLTGKLEKDWTFLLTADADRPEGNEKLVVNFVTEKEKVTREVELTLRNFNLLPGSGLVMGLSIFAVLVLVTFCVWRVMTLPPVEDEEVIKGPLEIDTGDTRDAD